MEFKGMEFKELFQLAPNYLNFEGDASVLSYIVIPKKTMHSRSKREVYTEGVQAQVRIDKFDGEEKFQLYRHIGHHVAGNSHRVYKSIDLLLEDFEIVQADHLPRRSK